MLEEVTYMSLLLEMEEESLELDEPVSEIKPKSYVEQLIAEASEEKLNKQITDRKKMMVLHGKCKKIDKWGRLHMVMSNKYNTIACVNKTDKLYKTWAENKFETDTEILKVKFMSPMWKRLLKCKTDDIKIMSKPNIQDFIGLDIKIEAKCVPYSWGTDRTENGKSIVACGWFVLCHSISSES